MEEGVGSSGCAQQLSSQFRLADPLTLRAALASPHPPLVLEACIPGQTAPRPALPGAVLLSLEAIDVYQEDARTGHPLMVSGNYSLRPPHELQAAFEAAGVTHLRPAVVYTQAAKAGGLDLAVACRLCWALSLCGVSHVSLLPGGTRMWEGQGYPLAAGPAEPVPKDFWGDAPPGMPFPLRPELCAATREVEDAARRAGSGASAGQLRLADVRSWREFSGEGHDYPFPLPCGRIPGARWAHWGPSTYRAGDFFSHKTGELHPLTRTEALWREWGLEPGRGIRTIFYCGSGWRSAVAWCLARLLGFEDCASYDGGFLEWAMLDPHASTHPIARGWEGGAGCAPPLAAAAAAAEEEEEEEEQVGGAGGAGSVARGRGGVGALGCGCECAVAGGGVLRDAARPCAMCSAAA